MSGRSVPASWAPVMQPQAQDDLGPDIHMAHIGLEIPWCLHDIRNSRYPIHKFGEYTDIKSHFP